MVVKNSHGKTPLVGMLERHAAYSKLITSVPLSLFKGALVQHNPLRVEKEKYRNLIAEAGAIWELRKQMQRLFEKKKKTNAASFRQYIENGVFDEGTYTLPPVALVTPDHVDVAMFDTGEPVPNDFGVFGPVICYLEPGVTRVASFDGDTQAAALMSAYEELLPEDPRRATLAKLPVSVEFHFNTNISWARQAFHDRNVYGVRVNASLAIGMDSRDPYVEVMRHIESQLPALKNKISTTKRQLGSKDTELFTASAMRQFVATLHEGLGGLQKKEPAEMSDGELEKLKTSALEWMSALYSALSDKFANRAMYIPSAPAVLAALGAVGHDVYFEKTRHKDAALKRLRAVDWSKGPQWTGIAGKATASGNLSIGGPKEVSGHIYTAVTDSRSAKYATITERTAA